MTVGLALGAPAAGNDVAWATNALKQLERFLKAQSAATSFYNNSGSGLDSKNVQDAIDELEAAFVAAIALLQPLDADLTAIAALSPSNDDIIQRKAGAWTNRTVAQYLADLQANLTFGNTPIGGTIDWAGISTTVPTGWLFCGGQNVSRSTYAALFAALTTSATVTVTIATPAVVSWTAHGLAAGDPFVFRTTGALPTGFTAGTVYYVIAGGLTANAFELALTAGGAAINSTGSQSGVHTGWYAPYGDGDGSTTFTIPDARGRVSAGTDDMLGTSANRLTGLSGGVDGDVLGGTGGSESHTLTAAQIPSNTTIANDTALTGGGVRISASHTGSAGTAHNIVQPTIVFNKIIFAGA